eukprot:NODE_1136_length_2104_cov_47.503281_g959_i0.p1 GENE.NODE_1136_length_2104_cov_47.503281_g959_i0~~NODE_1136_length_2104_cov_47.503281_g959_i0.p1  ORF type:complete len:649 (-),score=132.55 NODE_1136_length_2104_cov_47.503281_g959_i0:79-2025(-)
MKISYKFKSGNEETLEVKGHEITVADFKKYITEKYFLKDDSLDIINAYTEEGIRDGEYISEGVSLIVRRVQTNKVSNEDESDGLGRAVLDLDVDPYAIFHKSKPETRSIQFDSSSEISIDIGSGSIRNNENLTRKVYTCFACGQQGHRWNDCPTYKKQQQQRAEQVNKKTSEVPNSVRCPLCKSLFDDAMIVSCCGETFCDPCVASSMLRSKKCPGCKDELTMSSIFPNSRIRDLVNDYRRQNNLPPAPKRSAPIPTPSSIKPTPTSIPLLVKTEIKPPPVEVKPESPEILSPTSSSITNSSIWSKLRPVHVSEARSRWCRNMEQVGSCIYGSKCCFAHTESELKASTEELANKNKRAAENDILPQPKKQNLDVILDPTAKTLSREEFENLKKQLSQNGVCAAVPVAISIPIQTPIRPGPFQAPNGPPRRYQGSMVDKSYTFTSTQNGGIIYDLGTMNSKYWKNPVDAKELRVCASSRAEGSLGLTIEHDFRKPLFRTEDVAYSWVLFDFGERSIRPNRYKLSQWGKGECYLRSWLFEGSDDNIKWTLLSRHDNDKSIDEHCPMASWPVITNEFYRYVRILLDPAGNSHRHSVLAFNCFDVYGDLKTPPAGYANVYQNQVLARNSQSETPVLGGAFNIPGIGPSRSRK